MNLDGNVENIPFSGSADLVSHIGDLERVDLFYDRDSLVSKWGSNEAAYIALTDWCYYGQHDIANGYIDEIYVDDDDAFVTVVFRGNHCFIDFDQSDGLFTPFALNISW